MNIIQNILTSNPCYKTGKKIIVEGLMLHSVGCNQPKASVFINQWDKADPATAVCPQGIIDGNSGDVYQLLPWNHYGYHAGGSANATHIGVEMGEPACIKYKKNSDRFTCSDVPAAKKVVQRTYDTAVQLFAHLCKQYNLDPLGDGVIISHAEGYKRGVASGHSDPEHLWEQLGMGYTMDSFRKAVKDSMSGISEDTDSNSDALYRVQVGAFNARANAEAILQKLKAAGFDGFITTAAEYFGDGNDTTDTITETVKRVKLAYPAEARKEPSAKSKSCGRLVPGMSVTVVIGSETIDEATGYVYIKIKRNGGYQWIVKSSLGKF